MEKARASQVCRRGQVWIEAFVTKVQPIRIGVRTLHVVSRSCHAGDYWRQERETVDQVAPAANGADDHGEASLSTRIMQNRFVSAKLYCQKNGAITQLMLLMLNARGVAQ